ncbi:hypothetical protein GGC65_002399 [Sphingopyxis sp. OAS728]|nr:hypothetical protein [Sphingopyxis sp. OAS728]
MRFILAEDEQMARLQPYFPKGHGRKRVFSGIIFVTRNG